MAEQYRFFELDNDAGVVIEYERLGECNGCGMCCMEQVAFAIGGKDVPQGWDFRNGWHPVNKGKSSGVLVNGHWRWFSNFVFGGNPNFKACHNLSADKRCKIHLGKTLLSRAWPITPDHAAAFSECSYTFQEINRWPMDDFFSDRVTL